MEVGWTCPRCGSEYVEGVLVCIECQTDLGAVYAPDLPTKVVVNTHATGPTSAVVMGALNRALFLCACPYYWDGSGQLVVSSACEKAAREICSRPLEQLVSDGQLVVLPLVAHGADLAQTWEGLATACVNAIDAYVVGLARVAEHEERLLANIYERETTWESARERVLEEVRQLVGRIRSSFAAASKLGMFQILEDDVLASEFETDGDGPVDAKGEDEEGGGGDVEDHAGPAEIFFELCGYRDELYQSVPVGRIPLVGRSKLVKAVVRLSALAEEAAADLHEAIVEFHGPYRLEARSVATALRADLGARAEKELMRLRTIVQSTERGSGIQCAAWDSVLWTDWAPPAELPKGVRIGMLKVSKPPLSAELPAVLSLPGGPAIVLETQSNAEAALLGLQSLLLRLIAVFPPGSLKFVFIDPLGLGRSVAPLLHLGDYDDALIGGKVWTEPSHIEARLADLTEHIELVIQKYLRGQYSTIEEHNVDAGEVAEAYRVLVVLNFPQGFTDASVRRLSSIVANGPRCGVYPLILHDTSRPMPYGSDVKPIYETSVVIEEKEGAFRYRSGDLSRFTLTLDTPPPLALTPTPGQRNPFGKIIVEVAKVAKTASVVEVTQTKLFSLLASQIREDRGDSLPTVNGSLPDFDRSETWWRADSSRLLSVPIGRMGATAAACLAFGKGTAQHALIVGKTGSGKSTLLHAIVLNAALLYAPNELELYLIDFKKGVEFKPYASWSLPHARVVAIESEREFGLSVLRGLDAELARRGDLFRAAVPPVDNIADFRRHGTGDLPRILLVIDEFHELFSQEDRLASEAANLLDRIVRQGRAFGIHAVLGSQTLAGIRTIGRSTIEQIAVRIALQCSDADSRLVLAEDNPAARLLARPGEAIYNAANGMIEGNLRFQVVWLSDDEREGMLRTLRRLAERSGFQRVPIVFEGEGQAEIQGNRLLFSRPEGHTGCVTLWVGEPLEIADPVSVTLRAQAASNVLMVGRDENHQAGVVSAMVVSGIAAGADVQVLDFTPLDQASSVLLGHLSAKLPRVLLGRRRQVEGVLTDLVATVRDRYEQGSQLDRPIMLVLHGVGRAREFDPNDGGERGSLSPMDMLREILRDGPEVGVHAIATADTLNSLQRRLDRRAMREFSMRIGLRMGANDSAELFDGPGASDLRDSQAILIDEDEARLTKFRMYGVPALEWFEKVGATFRGSQLD